MKLLGGTVHDVPNDFCSSIDRSSVGDIWNSLTPLARNEFICWIISPKKPETRARRIIIAIEKLQKGERRPCCWIGCVHRTDKDISPSVAGILKNTSTRPPKRV